MKVRLLYSLPQTLVILGSGWDKVLDKVNIEKEYSYSDVFGIKTTVPGHEGRLIIGKIKMKPVAFMAGRIHLYEGLNPEITTKPIDFIAKAGVKNLIITSAAGAINEKYKVGDFIILSDLITLFLSGKTPLVGPKFLDLSEVFDPKLRRHAINICATNAIPFHEGIYSFAHGPQFETPADKMMLKIIGADVVGMSTVPETLVAKSHGMKVLGLSYVTNLAFVKHEHKEVLAAAKNGSRQMVKLLEKVIDSIKN